MLEFLKTIGTGMFIIGVAVLIFAGIAFLTYAPMILTIYTPYDWTWLYWIEMIGAFWVVGSLFR